MRGRGHALGALAIRRLPIEPREDSLRRTAIAQRDQVPATQGLSVARQGAVLRGGVEELEHFGGTLEARGALREAKLGVAADLPALRIAGRELVGKGKGEPVVVFGEGRARTATNGFRQ